jgi:hypothetical protein
MAAPVKAAQQQTMSCRATFLAPLPADLVSVVAAATPANGSLTVVAGQPVHARKLQVRAVLGTPGTTNITGGVLAIAGFDQDFMPVSETINLACSVSTTFKTQYAYGAVSSAVLSGYTASGSGTGNTLGIGHANDFGIPTIVNVSNFALSKATKTITTVVGSVTGWSRVTTDDNAAGAVVDAVARTVAPTTPPAANGINDYEFYCVFNSPDRLQAER